MLRDVAARPAAALLAAECGGRDAADARPMAGGAARPIGGGAARPMGGGGGGGGAARPIPPLE